MAHFCFRSYFKIIHSHIFCMKKIIIRNIKFYSLYFLKNEMSLKPKSGLLWIVINAKIKEFSLISYNPLHFCNNKALHFLIFKISTVGFTRWEKTDLANNSISFLFYRARRNKECHYYTAISRAWWSGKIHQLQHSGAGFHTSWRWSEKWTDFHPH